MNKKIVSQAMNASCIWFEEEMIVNYSAAAPRRDQQRQTRMRRHAYQRRGARPTAYNGIHLRRNKRGTW